MQRLITGNSNKVIDLDLYLNCYFPQWLHTLYVRANQLYMVFDKFKLIKFKFVIFYSSSFGLA